MRKNARTIVITSLIFAGSLMAAASGAEPKPDAKAESKPDAKAAKGPRPDADLSRVNPARPPDKSIVFKQTPQGELKLYFYFPQDWKTADRRPGIVFWFGGGFTHGTPSQFYAKAEYLASRGLVCSCAEYRIKSAHGTGLDKCAEDARSAIRWVKKHAGELGIDPGKVIASGGSAGGTLSLLVTLAAGPDANDDDLKISPKPCAMVLFNPAQGIAVESRIEGAGAEKDRVVKLISAMNVPQPGEPPAIMFFGTADRLLPPSREFCQKALTLGNRCELWTAEGQGHGFFNRQPWHAATLRKADEFLTSLGYLRGEPQIKPDPTAVLKRELPER